MYALRLDTFRFRFSNDDKTKETNSQHDGTAQWKNPYLRYYCDCINYFYLVISFLLYLLLWL